MVFQETGVQREDLALATLWATGPSLLTSHCMCLFWKSKLAIPSRPRTGTQTEPAALTEFSFHVRLNPTPEASLVLLTLLCSHTANSAPQECSF